jgi:hypothetical protein
MTVKKFVKAFVSGMAFPAVFLPLAYTCLYLMQHRNLTEHPIQFIPMYLPLVWGLANVINLKVNDEARGKNINKGLWVTGLCLGFVVAAIGVFKMHIPTMIFGQMHGFEFAPLIVLPIVYGLLFRYVVKWLNKTIAV